MARLKRIIFLSLCLLAVAALAAMQAGAADLPIKFSTSGRSYQYAIPSQDPTSVAYGTSTSTAVKGSVSAALSGDGISVSLDTGNNMNFKLCYMEIPVTVTVPANTTYTVTLDFALNGTYTRSNRKATAKASFQVVYLGDAATSNKVVFYPYTNVSGSTVKTTINGSDSSTNIIRQSLDSATDVKLSTTKSYSFTNTASTAKDITQYFGVWIAGNFGRKYSNQAKATCTVTPTSITYPITFDANANGVTVSPASMTVTLGSAYGTLPAPTRTGGYTFDGWYTAKTGGTKITDTTTVSTAHGTTLYAHWSLTPAETPVIDSEPSDKTIVYGTQLVLNLTCHGESYHTLTQAMYECDENGNNGTLSSTKRPSAGVHYYYILVTATRQDNGEAASTKSRVATVTVNKAVPEITIPPSAKKLDLAVCPTLSGSEIYGGEVRNTKTRDFVSGTFTWQDGKTHPTTLGWQKFTAVFTPVEAANYTTNTTEVTVNVTCSHRYREWVNGKRTCTVCGKQETRNNTVTITWGALAYTYTDGTWQPEDHTYLGSGWTVDDPDGDAITVQNEGANAVKVTFNYESAQEFSTVMGSFADSVGQGLAASAVALPVGKAETVRLALSGAPSRAISQGRIGSVTVRLTSN